MKCLVTGGAGFIGSYLCEKLLEMGNAVLCVDQLYTGSLENIGHIRKNKNFEFIQENIMNYRALERLTAKCDIIFHLAAAVGVKLIVDDPVGTLTTNVRGTEILLDLANYNKKKIFIASTSEIYGKNYKKGLEENDDRILGSTNRLRWSYSTSKAVDEYLAFAYHQEKGLEFVIGRFFNTIGPRQTGEYGMVVPRFVKAALTNRPLTVYEDGSQVRTFTYVTDAVDAVIGLMDEGKCIGEVFNIGSTEPITILDLAKKIIDLTGSSSEIQLTPYEKVYGSGFEDMKERIPNIDKIKRFINYQPKVSLEESLSNIIQFYKAKLKT